MELEGCNTYEMLPAVHPPLVDPLLFLEAGLGDANEEAVGGIVVVMAGVEGVVHMRLVDLLQFLQSGFDTHSIEG